MSENLIKFVIDDTVYETRLTRKYLLRKKYVAPDPNKLTAFIPGTIREIYVKEGQRVNEGDKLLILEAMKMKNTIFAPFACTIKSISVKTGVTVAKNQEIIEFQR